MSEYRFECFVLALLLAVGLAVHLQPYGNNVCRQNVTMTSSRVVSFEKNITHIYTTCCSRGWNGFCINFCEKNGTIKKTVSRLEVIESEKVIYRCCSGWTNLDKNDTATKECSYSLCDGDCNPGECIGKNRCQITYDSREGFKKEIILNTTINKPEIAEPCGEERIIRNEGSISLTGNSSNIMQTCKWKIIVPYKTMQFRFLKMDFATNTSCIDSLITIATDNIEYIFCSERKAKIASKMVFDAQSFEVKVTRRNWKEDDGIILNFNAWNFFSMN